MSYENFHTHKETESNTPPTNESKTEAPKDSKTEAATVESEDGSDDDEPYIPNAELELPENISIPSSMKQAAVVEKTAWFVARQGPQMEIVLKTKQANNPSFSFLTMDDKYNAYYKHVLKQIKMGRYHPQLQMLSHVRRNNIAKKGISKDEEKKEYNLNLPKVNTSGTSYAKLINQFKKYNKTLSTDDKDSQKSGSSTPISTEVNTETADCSATTTSNNVDDSKKMDTSAKDSVQNATTSYNNYEQYSNSVRPELPVGPIPNQTEDPEGYARYYEQWQAYYHWYYQYYNYPENSEHYSQSQGSQSENAYSRASGEIASRSSNSSRPQDGHVGVVDRRDQASKTKESIRKSESASSHSGKIVSASKSVNDTQTPSEPSEALRPIIDKMAEYVARNGIDFEAMVRVKKDQRFQFLDASHPYHSYYQRRRRDAELAIATSQAKRIVEEKRRQLHEELASETLGSMSEVSVEVKKEPSSAITVSAGMNKNELTDVRKEKTDSEVSNNMDIHTSDDGKRIISISHGSSSISFQLKKESVIQKPVPLADDEDDDSGAKEDEKNNDKRMDTSSHADQGDPSDMSRQTDEKEEGEISPTVDDGVDEVERKLANKLAAAARDKLARVNRESLMQAERKKRAAAFMAKIRATEIGSSLASRLEKKRRAEEEREKEKERAAAALEMANRAREKTPPAAYASISSVVNSVEPVANRSLVPRHRPSPELSHRSSHHRRDRGDRDRDRDRDRERDRERERERDRDRQRERRRSRSRSREKRDYHRRGGHYRRHHERR